MTEIYALQPATAGPLSRPDIVALYDTADRATPWLRVNFIESIDGSATLRGRSGGLGQPADKAVFDILRGIADVVLVGAGTVRAEGYGALTVSDEFVSWRRERGLADHPAMAIVSGRLDLDPESDLFAKAPSRPLVFTVASAPPDARARLEPVATVIEAGETSVDPAFMRRELVSRGLAHVLCEGGPLLFGELIAADLVDELCLTLSPLLEGGTGPRIATPPAGATPPAPAPRGMELAHVLQSESLLLTRWVRGQLHSPQPAQS